MVLLIIRCVVLIISVTAIIVPAFARRLGDLSILLVLMVFVIFPSILALGVSALRIRELAILLHRVNRRPLLFFGDEAVISLTDKLVLDLW